MTLPGSGALAMSAIMDEIGRDAFPSPATSINNAENGTYEALNTNSASRPNSADPAAFS